MILDQLRADGRAGWTCPALTRFFFAPVGASMRYVVVDGAPIAQLDHGLVRAADAGEAKTIRDRMIYRILAETELYYRTYEARVFADRGRLAFSGELAELSLAAGAAVSRGTRGKTILTTLLTAATGARLSFDQNFFREKTTEAILAQIAVDRGRIRARIETRMAQTVEEYPFEAAWSDLVELFFAGTLEGGLQSLHRRVLDGR